MEAWGLTRSVAVLLAVLTAVLTVVAWRRDGEVLASGWLSVCDLGVGLMFPLAGAFARGAAIPRLAFSSVGPAWLAGSVSGWFVGLHQGVLLVALAVFPRARPWLASLSLAVGVGVAVAAPEALFTGLTFAAFAALFLLVDLREVIHERGFSVLAAAGLAGVLVHAHWLAAASRPAVPLLYEGALVACAAGFIPASVVVTRRRRGFGSQALTGSVGVEGLEGLLAAAVRDPGLRLAPDGRVLSASVVLSDRDVAESVAQAVRIVIRHEQLRREDLVQVDALESARTRLVSAVDDERARVAEELEQRVGNVLDAAMSTLRGRAPEVSAALRPTRAEIDRVVAGLPPGDLRRVGLRGAMQRLTAVSPLVLEVDIADSVAPDVEAALFFVSCEAISNAIKHSGASRLRFRLEVTGDGLVYTASDDGGGGADAGGSGLSGLVDRVDAVGGTLKVVSPPGRGTTITVRVSSKAPRRDVGNVRSGVVGQDRLDLAQ